MKTSTMVLLAAAAYLFLKRGSGANIGNEGASGNPIPGEGSGGQPAPVTPSRLLTPLNLSDPNAFQFIDVPNWAPRDGPLAALSWLESNYLNVPASGGMSLVAPAWAGPGYAFGWSGSPFRVVLQ